MDVLLLRDVDTGEMKGLLARYRLDLTLVLADAIIPGSYWGDSEAGLAGERLYARGDTPVHSILHETGHFACMTSERRGRLFRDAGGDDAEESAVCYLQVLLSDHVPGIDRPRIFQDMDAWGYSFRLGSTRRWFEEDAADASAWLKRERLIDFDETPRWTRRGET